MKLRILFQRKPLRVDQEGGKKPSSPTQFLTTSTHYKETAGHAMKDTVHRIYHTVCHPLTHAALLLPPRPCCHLVAPA